MGKAGRPRSEKSREAILKATDELLYENGGAGLTVEAIARRAGAGKPTIYRWWPSVADIVSEVLLSRADAGISIPSSGTLRETLRQFLRESMGAIMDGSGVHLRFLMAYAQQHEEFRERFRDNFSAKRREVLRSILQQGVKRGETGRNHNPDVLVDLIFGAMWYRLLIGHLPMDDLFADELAEVICSALTGPTGD